MYRVSRLVFFNYIYFILFYFTKMAAGLNKTGLCLTFYNAMHY